MTEREKTQPGNPPARRAGGGLAQILQNMGIDVISALKCSLSKEKTKLGQSGKTRQKNRIKNCIVFFLRRKILQILVKRYKKVIYKLLICFNLLINY